MTKQRPSSAKPTLKAGLKAASPPITTGIWHMHDGWHAAPRAMRRSPALRIDSIHYKEANLNYHTTEHVHQVHQWFLCVHGGMTVAVDGIFFELRPEQSLIIAPGALRETWSARRAPGYLVAHFSNRRLDLAPITGRLLSLPPDERDDLRALVAEVRRPRDSDAADLVEALLIRLLIGHRRGSVRANDGAHSAASNLNQRQQSDVVRDAQVFMQRNLHRTLSRDEIAAAVGYSPPHLARLFRASAGTTMLERLTELRLVRAKELLVESNRTVTLIAGDVGFSSFSHFAKIFKRALGVSPSDYRRGGGHAGAGR